MKDRLVLLTVVILLSSLGVGAVSAGTTARWSFLTGDVINSVAYGGGRVYAGSVDGKVYGLNAVTGAKIWDYTTGAWNFVTYDSGKVFISAPAIDGIGVPTGNDLYCLNATNGAKIWQYTPPAEDRYTGVLNTFLGCPVVSGGYVYVGSDLHLYCLNVANGQRVWWENITECARFTAGGGYVYAGANDSKLYCFNGATGVKSWDFTTGSMNFGGITLSGSNVYFGSADTKLYCRLASTGAKVWDFTSDDTISSEVTVSGGAVFFASAGTAYSLDATTGVQLWKTHVTDTDVINGFGMGTGGYTYASCTDSNLYALNTISGNLIWSYTTGGGLDNQPIVVGNTVYFGSNDDYVYAVEASGQVGGGGGSGGGNTTPITPRDGSTPTQTKSYGGWETVSRVNPIYYVIPENVPEPWRSGIADFSGAIILIYVVVAIATQFIKRGKSKPAKRRSRSRR